MTDSLKERLQDLIDYCEEPVPPYLGDAHAVRLRARPVAGVAGSYVYRGLLLFRPLPGKQSYSLEGYGSAGPAAEGIVPQPDPRALMIKVAVQIGRFAVIETALDFGYLLSESGWHSVRSESADASYHHDADFDGHILRLTSAAEIWDLQLYTGTIIPR